MSDNYRFQLNVKFDEGYDSPLLNIVGDTQEEFQQNVEFAASSAAEIAKAATMLQAAYKLAKPKDEPQNGGGSRNGSWSNRGSQQASQQQQSQQPDGPAPTCRHGEMKYVAAGFSQRTKKNYNAFWSCTGPRNEQCDTQPA